MPTYVITLIPEKKLCNIILNLKNKAKKIVGNQLYIDDLPHITLYIINVKESFFDDFEEKISLKKFNIYISGWLNFLNDPITKKNTITFRIKKNKEIDKYQKDIINLFDNIKKNVSKRYKKMYPSLNKEFKNNIELYGYPFIGNIWKPHISIASFDKESFNKIYDNFKKIDINGSYYIDSLNIYKLDENKNKLKLLKRIKMVN